MRVHSTLLLHLMAAVVAVAAAAVYVPGEPGAAWTKHELLIVKAKLRQLYHRSSDAPKALRLSFHDCLRYTDGSGGCDGCLNWRNVGKRNQLVKLARNLPDITETDNNGLGDIVRKLEQLYTKTDYPDLAPNLAQSLKDTGKSRADLWAYAAIVAVEWGIEANNIACEDYHDTRLKFGSGLGTCVHDETEPGCKIVLPRSFNFETGRADCVEHDPELTYKATKDEHHPNFLDNGRRTVEFFKKDFNMNGREVVAIFGAHTFGKPHPEISQIPYTWTSRATNLFNNDYYKSLTGRDRWFMNENTCRRVGDAFGNRPKSKWIAHTRMSSYNGGPTFWIHHNHACPNCIQEDHVNSVCCTGAGENVCRPDSSEGGSGPRTPDEEDGDDNKGCERLRLISGADEIALNCEMGLYLDFEVDNGVLYGCPGLEIFNETMSASKGRTVWSTRSNGRGKDQPLCEKQMMAEPAGSTPLYQIMDEYADDQDKWIYDFMPTFEKMLGNGYPSGLNPSESFANDPLCPLDYGKKPEMICYEDQKMDPNSAPFMIGSIWSKLAGRVMQLNIDTMTVNLAPITGELNQQWIMSNNGDMMFNMENNRPFSMAANVIWDIRKVADEGFMLKSLDGWALDCRAELKNRPCRLRAETGRPWQKFQMIPLH